MELREINYILSIYRHGNITKAAAELYITQPALSKFLKNLEHQIGAVLFSRIGNELIPTYIGERYISYAMQIEEIKSNWNLECLDLIGESKGKLSIAIPLMRGSCLIPEILNEFYNKYPEVEVSFHEEAHSVEKHLLSSDDIDLVIYNDTTPAVSLIHEELGREEIVLIMSSKHPLVEKAVQREGCKYPWIDLSFTRKESFVLHPNNQTTGRITRQLLGLANVNPKLLVETRNSEVAISIAVNGKALAFAPESYVKKRYDTDALKCFSIGAPKSETILYAIYRKGRYLPSYARYFLLLVKEYMGRV